MTSIPRLLLLYQIYFLSPNETLKLIIAGFLATSSLAHGQATLTWDQPNPNNAWNTTDANWTSGATFVTGDNVIFNSATGETVTVATGGVSAGTMAVGANNGSWVF